MTMKAKEAGNPEEAERKPRNPQKNLSPGEELLL
jgi:hypothetical protein